MAVKTYMYVCFKCKTFLQINKKLWPLVISRFHCNKKTPTNIPVTIIRSSCRTYLAQYKKPKVQLCSPNILTLNN